MKVLFQWASKCFKESFQWEKNRNGAMSLSKTYWMAYSRFSTGLGPTQNRMTLKIWKECHQICLLGLVRSSINGKISDFPSLSNLWLYSNVFVLIWAENWDPLSIWVGLCHPIIGLNPSWFPLSLHSSTYKQLNFLRVAPSRGATVTSISMMMIRKNTDM